MTNYVLDVGAVVWLNSGGPYMTVTDITYPEDTELGDDEIGLAWLTCEWFDHDADGIPYGPPQRAVFWSAAVTVLMDDVEDTFED